MAQVDKRAYTRKSADDQIRELQNKIKEIKQREVVKVQKLLDKKYILIGRAVVDALNDEFVSNTLFTQIVSQYLYKPSELDSLREDFTLDEDIIVPKKARGRGRPRGARNKLRVATIHEDVDTSTGEVTTKNEVKEVLALPEKDVKKVEKTSGPKPSIIKKKKTKAIVKPKPVVKAVPEIEKDEDPIEPGDAQGNIIDPRLHLDGIENFARRGRLLDRLRASEVHTLSDLITRTERQFSNIPGIQTGTVRTCKAILHEMNIGFAK